VIDVDLNVFHPFVGKILFRVDRLNWTLVNAQATVDARIRIDEELCSVSEIIFIRLRMDAINRTDIYAGGVLRSYAGFSNYMSHGVVIFRGAVVRSVDRYIGHGIVPDPYFDGDIKC
jgi:hypothetical protein